MWTRENLKSKAKIAFYRNYWTSVIAGIIIAVAAGIVNISLSMIYLADEAGFLLTSYMGGNNGVIVTSSSLLFSVTIIVLCLVLLQVFIGNLLIVGVKHFFMENRKQKTSIHSIIFGIKSNHRGKIVMTMFLKDLFTMLWSLLLIVPGIIKYYEYRMIPYILCENPELSVQEVFALSKKMMNGQKMDTFILDISFIGWMFIRNSTCGVAGVFFLNPYREATYAELYATLRSNALNIESVNGNELPEVDC